MQSVVFFTFIILSLLNLLHFAFYLVGANLYDIRQFRHRSKRPKRLWQKRPLVTILIPAYNEELSILRCIESVRKSSYKKIEIVVVDDASRDTTRKLIRDYIRQHPRYPVKLLWRRTNQGKASALNHGLRRATSGELVMMLDGDSLIERDTIKNAVKYFKDPEVVGVAANVRIIDSRTILGLLQKFEHMVGYRSKKFYSLTNCEYIVGGVASTYRTEVVRKVGYYDHDTITEDIGLSLKIASQGNRHSRLIYASDVVAMTEGVHNFRDLLKQRYRWKMGGLQNLYKYRGLFLSKNRSLSRWLTIYRIPLAFFGEFIVLIEPLLIGYILYLTMQADNLAMFTGSYVLISLYILLVLLPDEHTELKRKMELTLYVPVLYFIFYIMNFIQFISIIRCALNFRQFIHLDSVSGRWDSPKRLGQDIIT